MPRECARQLPQPEKVELLVAAVTLDEQKTYAVCNFLWPWCFLSRIKLTGSSGPAHNDRLARQGPSPGQHQGGFALRLLIVSDAGK